MNGRVHYKHYFLSHDNDEVVPKTIIKNPLGSNSCGSAHVREKRNGLMSTYETAVKSLLFLKTYNHAAVCRFCSGSWNNDDCKGRRGIRGMMKVPYNRSLLLYSRDNPS